MSQSDKIYQSPNICPTCGKECKSEKGMKQHHTRTHGESLNRVERKCSQCGDIVVKDYNEIKNCDNIFCSDKCDSEWRSENLTGSNHHNHKERVTLLCEFCEESFEEYPYRADDARFCSQKCSGKFKTESGTSKISCEWCETEYREQNCKVEREEHHFCSKACYGSWQSVNKTGQNHPNWTGGANLYEAIRENLSDEPWSRIAELSRDDRCYKCGESDTTLHEHHTIPVMFGGSNNDELLMTLCESCHRTVESYTMKKLNTNIMSVV